MNLKDRSSINMASALTLLTLATIISGDCDQALKLRAIDDEEHRNAFRMLNLAGPAPIHPVCLTACGADSCWRQIDETKKQPFNGHGLVTLQVGRQHALPTF